MNLPPFTALTSEASRQVLIEYVLRNDTQPDVSRNVSPDAIFRAIYQECDARRVAPNWNAVITFWWDLARVGGVALIGGAEAPARGFPSFILTDFGRKLLTTKDVSPHDRDGYMASLRTVANVDAVALAYAEESVGAWHAELHRASVVMLGCACERLVLMLAESVRDNRDLEPFCTDLTKMLAPPKKGVTSGRPAAGISDVFARVREAVEVVGGEEFDRTVTSVFEHARMLRNEAGHPTGREVSKQEALAGLVLFPGFHGRVTTIIDRVRAYKRTS